MSEHHKQERTIGGGTTIEERDQAEIEEVQSQLLDHVRARKGLSVVPEQFDVKTIAQLSNAKIIDEDQLEGTEIDSKIVDISALTPKHSAVGADIRAGRVSRLKKAA